MADTAYDADHLRQAIAAKGALAVIPNNPSRAHKYPLDKHLYAQRHLVECCFSKLKQFRRVATRFEKTARNYRAVVTLAAIILWLELSTRPKRSVMVGDMGLIQHDPALDPYSIRCPESYLWFSRHSKIARIAPADCPRIVLPPPTAPQ